VIRSPALVVRGSGSDKSSEAFVDRFTCIEESFGEMMGNKKNPKTQSPAKIKARFHPMLNPVRPTQVQNAISITIPIFYFCTAWRAVV
tara:strand:+ start:1304 stop:1567 length:264 start_codon:yes stop_codon:yes gene_type:complete